MFAFVVYIFCKHNLFTSQSAMANKPPTPYPSFRGYFYGRRPRRRLSINPSQYQEICFVSKVSTAVKHFQTVWHQMRMQPLTFRRSAAEAVIVIIILPWPCHSRHFRESVRVQEMHILSGISFRHSPSLPARELFVQFALHVRFLNRNVYTRPIETGQR